MAPRLLVVAALILAASACGGGGDAPAPAAQKPERAASSDTRIAADLAAEGWRTDFRRHSVALEEFVSGGPPKDGIPAIDRPRFVSVKAGDVWFEPKEPVIELVVEGAARAYPIQVLVWHEIVNDEIAGVPVAVTFCPLCNTAIVFDRRVEDATLSFGTTGKLRNSDLVMYDRKTESWWQQFGGDGVVGRYTGERLRELPARIVAWHEFARKHPGGRVLSLRTGHTRPYGQNPYEGYDDATRPPLFPTANDDDDRLPPKERVVFVELVGEAVAVPYSALERRRTVAVDVGGKRLVVSWQPGVASSLDAESVAEGRDVGSASVTVNGRAITFSEPFWFAVAAFRPEVRIVR